ncbi:MAG: M20/M25/M40 family metallo-hydrolase [Patescibacteria group bacterium]
MLKYLKKLRQFKRDLNKIAELSWQEEKTKNYIVRNLGKDFYWTKKTALIYKLGNGIPVLFRAELDALPVKSEVKHVCGHSAHLAALMAAYLYLKNHPIKNFAIYFVFQPSEESYPSGAEFISKNFAELKKCQAAFAFHVAPNFTAGQLVETTLASGDYFEIKIQGHSVHIKDKNTEDAKDALITASELIQKINHQKSHRWIVNVGTIKGGEAPNKIAGQTILTGDIRALAEPNRRGAYQWLKTICAEIQKSEGAKIKLYYYKGYPVLKNDPKLLLKIKRIFKIKTNIKSFGTEDFSLYPIPKIFLHVGTGGKIKLHADNFSVSSAVVQKIFSYWVKLAGNLNKLVNS